MVDHPQSWSLNELFAYGACLYRGLTAVRSREGMHMYEDIEARAPF
jgi:hypothetical protein